MTEMYTFDDVLLIPAFNSHSSRKDVTTRSTDSTGKLTLDLPVMTANMDTVTGHEMANFIASKGGIGVLHRFMSIEDNIKEFKKCREKTFVSVGVSDNEFERAIALIDAGAEYVCIDVAHAHAEYVGKALKRIRAIASDICLMAGNVATKEGAQYLADNGADIIKVGIGGGSVCSTRIKTGFGVPTLASVKECSTIDRSIVADGGIKTAGDIVKALAFGADFVMIGGMLAGTRPTPGKIAYTQTGPVKEYRGMASKEAQEDFIGVMPNWKTSEGVSTYVEYRTDEDEVVADIVGGLRSGLTYAGSGSIKEMQSKARHVIITQSGKIESMPHKLLR